MKTLTKIESIELVQKFMAKLKKEAAKSNIPVEYFQLELTQPHFERCDCAYIQAADKKTGILYEAILNRFFAVVLEKGTPTLYSLSGNITQEIPNAVKDKLFWVCGNKKDKILDVVDFNSSFSLTKPKM